MHYVVLASPVHIILVRMSTASSSTRDKVHSGENEKLTASFQLLLLIFILLRHQIRHLLENPYLDHYGNPRNSSYRLE